jgi:hypothetical protein
MFSCNFHQTGEQRPPGWWTTGNKTSTGRKLVRFLAEQRFFTRDTCLPRRRALSTHRDHPLFGSRHRLRKFALLARAIFVRMTSTGNNHHVRIVGAESASNTRPRPNCARSRSAMQLQPSTRSRKQARPMGMAKKRVFFAPSIERRQRSGVKNDIAFDLELVSRCATLVFRQWIEG